MELNLPRAEGPWAETWQDAVGIDVEGDLDLGIPRGAGGMPTSSKRPMVLCVPRHLPSPCSTWIDTAFGCRRQWKKI